MLESSNLQKKSIAVINLKVRPESGPPVVSHILKIFLTLQASLIHLSPLTQRVSCLEKHSVACCQDWHDVWRDGVHAIQQSDPKPDPADMQRAMDTLKVCSPIMKALKRFA